MKWKRFPNKSQNDSNKRCTLAFPRATSGICWSIHTTVPTTSVKCSVGCSKYKLNGCLVACVKWESAICPTPRGQVFTLHTCWKSQQRGQWVTRPWRLNCPLIPPGQVWERLAWWRSFGSSRKSPDIFDCTKTSCSSSDGWNSILFQIHPCWNAADFNRFKMGMNLAQSGNKKSISSWRRICLSWWQVKHQYPERVGVAYINSHIQC